MFAGFISTVPKKLGNQSPRNARLASSTFGDKALINRVIITSFVVFMAVKYHRKSKIIIIFAADVTEHLKFFIYRPLIRGICNNALYENYIQMKQSAPYRNLRLDAGSNNTPLSMLHGQGRCTK